MSEAHSTDIKLPGGAALTVPTKSVGPHKRSAAWQKKTLDWRVFIGETLTV